MAVNDTREYGEGGLNNILVEDQSESTYGEDICEPLKTLAELRDWSSSPHPSWARKVIKLRPSSTRCSPGSDVASSVGASTSGPLTRCEISSVPKTLVCHDYKGGYQEDKYVDGSKAYNEYRFFHWSGVDTFVYFSHHFVTIPPLVWINSGHRHGVKVLGTVITEWKDGMALWDAMLESAASIRRYADSLADVCRYFGFDGYLLNVENEVKREDVGKLELFVRTLRERLPSSAQLIWYDSVTVEGLLKWQNQLNDLNKHWFDACDGIFLNYGWREADLEASVLAAGARRLDVYVGVDVFGRGVYGGGGFNSDKALCLIRQHRLSVAVFAPGWVHETQPEQHFTELEYLFWRKLWPHLHIRGPTHLPFDTSFCQGYGLRKYTQGVGVHAPWYNVGLQEYQPTVPSDLSECCLHLSVVHGVSLPAQLRRGCVQHYQHDGFYGGGCLNIQRPTALEFNDQADSTMHRLFVCCFESAAPLLVSCATKTASPDDTTALDLVLVVEEPGSHRFRLLTLTESATTDDKRDVVIKMQTEEVIALLEEKELKINPLGNNGWKQSFYMLRLAGERIVEIRAAIRGAASSILLGNLRVIPL